LTIRGEAAYGISWQASNFYTRGKISVRDPKEAGRGELVPAHGSFRGGVGRPTSPYHKERRGWGAGSERAYQWFEYKNLAGVWVG